MGDMTGDAPQPGETPRDDGTPWSHTDPASPWWRAEEQDPAADRPRHPRRRAAPTAPATAAASASATPTIDPPQPAQHTGEAAVAHQAGAADVRVALTGEARKAAATFTVPDHPVLPGNREKPEQAEKTPAQPERADQVAARKPTAPRHAQPAAQQQGDKAVERDHDRVDAERFNTEGQGTVYAARSRVRPVAGPEREPTIVDLLTALPVEPAHAEAESKATESKATDAEAADPKAADPKAADPKAADAQRGDVKGPDAETAGRDVAEPDVMVLPEPDRNRPTVALERGAVPGQQPSRPVRTREDPARADRALQDRVRQERTAALLETSPFWKAEEERRTQGWPPAETREKPATAGRPPRRRAPQPRRPAAGLFAMLALGLIAAFFAWVSAEPFWLAVGHGDSGTATVERCTGAGVTQRCAGRFTAADGSYRVDGLALFGVDPGQRAPGATTAARMVSSESRQAYVGGPGLLMHLRWVLSFVLVLLCGLGIAGLTGARRLDTARARRGALLVSVAGPLVLLAGFLFLTY
jgi:hypothetical protein